MRLQWKNFNIDLASMAEFLRNEVPESDGILADVDGFEIVEASPFSPEIVASVNEYYDSLTSEGEALKIAFPHDLVSAVVAAKEEMLSKSFDELSVVEKKILLGIILTREEEVALVDWYLSS